MTTELLSPRLYIRKPVMSLLVILVFNIYSAVLLETNASIKIGKLIKIFDITRQPIYPHQELVILFGMQSINRKYCFEKCHPETCRIQSLCM